MGRVPIRLDFLSLLHPLCQCPEVGGRNFESLVMSRSRIENALLLYIRLVRSSRMTHGMASSIPESGLFAGLDALACHERAEGT